MREFIGRVVAPGTVTAPALVSHGGLNTLASFQKALQFGDKKATCGDQNNPDLHGKELGDSLIAEGAQEYIIDDAELQRVQDNYPVIWKNADAKPKLCFIGCPHLSMQQLIDWTVNVEEGLKKNGLTKVTIPTVFTTAPAVKKEFEKTEYAARLKATGVILSYICPLMYMNNPLAGKMPVITCSNKLRTYTTARYYTEAQILDKITKGGK